MLVSQYDVMFFSTETIKQLNMSVEPDNKKFSNSSFSGFVSYANFLWQIKSGLKSRQDFCSSIDAISQVNIYIPSY